MMLISSRLTVATKTTTLALMCLVNDSAQPRAKVCHSITSHLKQS